MTKIKFGFILPQIVQTPADQHAFLQQIHRALELVSGHFDAMYVIDHLGIGDIESFTSLAYLAGIYPKLKIGHTVICQSFRNPALVARMGATLQMFSGGRFMLGIGTGWNEEEYIANGYDFPRAGLRVEQLEEAIQIIRALWTEKNVSFAGKHYRVNAAECSPQPDPIPSIMVGAFKPKTLRITAKYADEWNVSSTGIIRYQLLVDEFTQACQDLGRDPHSVQRSWGGGCICRQTQSEAEHIGGDRYTADVDEDFSFVGTPDQIIHQIQPFVELGVSSFMFDCGGFPDLTTLELLINRVIPAFNRPSEPA